MQKQERFCGRNKIVEGRTIDMETQNKKQNQNSVWSSSSPKFVSYLSNFQIIIIITKD
jgi:hypothetical protein